MNEETNAKQNTEGTQTQAPGARRAAPTGPSRDERKKALAAYQEKKQTGAVYRYVNRETGWQSPLCKTPNLEGMRSRFAFAQKTGSCVEHCLSRQWAQYGGGVFALEVLETLDAKADATPAEFRGELQALLELWQERYPTEP